MAMLPFDPAEQLGRERFDLQKAELDIANGRLRLHAQEARRARFPLASPDWRQADQLVEIFRQTLDEWEKHRNLIRGRIAYLERQVAAGAVARAGSGNGAPRQRL